MSNRLFLSFSGLAALALLVYGLASAAGAPGPAAIALAVVIATAALLSRLFGRPLRRAADFARQLAHEGSTPRLPDTVGGDAGDLYRALNRLADEQRRQLAERGAEQTETEVLLQEMGEGVLALDRSGRVVRANPELRTILGASESPRGRALATLFRNPDLISFLAPESVPDRGAQAEFDVFGRTMLVTARKQPTGGVVAVFSDLTELRRLDRVRTEFVANASHELKTPLTAIRGYAETLATRHLPEADRSRFADRIIEHTHRMTALVEDLLTLARLEDGTTIARERVEVLPLAELVVEALGDRSQAADIEVSLEIEPRDLAVTGDAEGLRQILENLVDNALRHASATAVNVAAKRLPDGVVEITVNDDGRGIPAAHLKHIFERFYRADASRSRETGGTGLGLAIVKHWTEGMGGRVRAESTVGGGTAVHVTFQPGIR